MPRTTLVAGTTITASWANANVRDQVVTPFASAAARTSAIASPAEGMVSYQSDTDRFDYYSGAAWECVSLNSFSGSDTALVGANRTAGQRVYMQSGTAATTTNSGGGFNIALSPTFAGIRSILVTGGDTASSLGFAVPVLASCTTSLINGIAYTTVGVGVNALVIRLNYEVVGW